jgi:benzoyl-CoA reductase/2-hydroxyglutaryl-CoA dehydratase subunit BcrC/BadD/HgdB
MSVTELYQYPEDIKDEFITTEDIVFRDGTHKSAAEIWHFMTKAAPVKYPYAFTKGNHYHRRLSKDVTLPSTIKHNYLILTMNERITKARANGTPVVFVQGGQSVDPYYAAGAIALRPASTGLWAAGQHEGNNLNQEELRRMDQREKAHHATSFEICQTAGYENIQEGNLPVDMIAPFTCLRCSDISYGVEAHRHGKRKLNLFLGDYPMSHQKDKPWAVDYFAQNLRRLTKEINDFTGRTTTDADLWAEIKLHNAGRRLAVDTAEAWWSADAPPTNGIDRRAIFQMGSMEVHGDPNASLTVLKEANRYIKERVRNGIKGEGVQDDPARIFVCGSCVRPNEYRTEEAGGIMVGNDNHWSDISTIVDEEGDDPYVNLSRAILSYPYEQDIKGRVAWTVDQLKKSRAHGVLFLYNWGCNTQSAIARMLCDEVKKQTNLPSLIIEHDHGGVQSEQLQNRVNAFVEMVRP